MRFSATAACLLLLSVAVGEIGCWKSPFFSKESWQFDSSEHGGRPGPKRNTCPCGWANKNAVRIVGGRESSVNEFPFAVALLTDRGFHFCGGSIIGPSHVLTAAHCTAPVIKAQGTILVLAGDHDFRTTSDTPYAQLRRVARIVQHQQYDPMSMINDVSVLFLDSPLTFNRYVGPVCLPSAPKNYAKLYVKIIGWGNTHHNSTTSPVQKNLNIRVVDHTVCRSVWRQMSPIPTQLCTHSFGQGACMGDSGGPVVWLDPETNMYTQVGLVSFGKICASLDPTVHTDVYYHNTWITSAVASTSYGGGVTLCRKIA